MSAPGQGAGGPPAGVPTTNVKPGASLLADIHKASMHNADPANLTQRNGWQAEGTLLGLFLNGGFRIEILCADAS